MVQWADERIPAALLVLVATMWIVAPMHAGWQGDPLVLIVPVIGVALALIGLARWSRCTRVVIQHGIVEVTIGRLTAEWTRREPLSDYVELWVRHEEQPHRYGSRHWHLLELRHADPSKSIVLASAREPMEIDRRARELELRLGLPLMGARSAAVTG